MAWMVACVAVVGAVGVSADEPVRDSRTLLVVRTAENALDFVDPGSGLRLASVPIGSGPRHVSVAPDGTRAAVSACGQPGSPGGTPVTLSVVDLEHPRELQRSNLALRSCPAGLTWFEADRIAVATDGPEGQLAVEVGSGRIVGELSAAERAAVARSNGTRQPPDASAVAVQQFLASGGDPRALATTPVMPLAPCHACTPAP